MRLSILPFLFLAVPIAEIAAFIVVGGQIGVLPTLAMIFVTAVIGSFLLRSQGIGIISKIATEVEANRVPARELVHGVMIAIAGVLLLTPGFITDTLGFLLFVPSIREAGWQFLKSRITIITPQRGGRDPFGRTQDGVVDLDDTEYTRAPDDNSPWRNRLGPDN